jgi:magnesium transporter
VSEAVAAAMPVLDSFLRAHPAEAAQVLDRSSPEDAAALLAAVPRAVAAPLLLAMNPDMSTRVLVRLDAEVSGALLGALDPAAAAQLCARLAEPGRSQLLAGMTEDLRTEIGQILTYPDGTAGHIMQAGVTRFTERTRVENALAWLRQLRGRRLTEIVVTDDEARFVGVVPLQVLVGAPPEAPLGSLVDRDAASVPPMARLDDVVELIQKHRLVSVPVIDSARRVVGVIRHEGLVEAAQETAAGDALQMFGASQEEGALSKPSFSMRSRLPWLSINLLTAFLASAVVGLFQSTLVRFTALAVLMPIIAGQSGNTGAQALAVTMRSLALREIRPSHALRVLRKELLVGLLNGLAVATVTALAAFLWSHSNGLALVMFIAMLFSMVCASLAGAAVPIILARLGRDPAVASSIILTTITDVVGFVSFLGLATLLAGLLTDL